MRTGIGPFLLQLGRPVARHLSAWSIAGMVLFPAHAVRAAEFGADPWIKGFTDIYAGILPTEPGFYFRNDVYHYESCPASPPPISIRRPAGS